MDDTRLVKKSRDSQPNMKEVVGQGRGGVTACRAVVTEQDRVLTRKLKKKKKKIIKEKSSPEEAWRLFNNRICFDVSGETRALER